MSKRNKADREAAMAMHRVSAFSTERGLGLSEMAVDQKSNEIPVVRDLLDITDIRGCIVHMGRNEYAKRDDCGGNCEEGGLCEGVERQSAEFL